MVYNHTVLTYSYSINNHTAHETPRLWMKTTLVLFWSQQEFPLGCVIKHPNSHGNCGRMASVQAQCMLGYAEKRDGSFHTHTHKINKSQHVSHYIIRIIVKNTQYLTSRGSFKNTLKIHDFGDQSRLTIQNKTNNSF